ncbi:MAG: NAD-dependent epimerase/dehydratase family protein, partial [Treponema sp.]|nr:NAD-dependent epimerase/dehydratase family protein [Treponema sp.]
DSGLRGLASIRDVIQVFASDTYNDIFFAVEKFNPDVVIHLAALYINQHEPEQITGLINTNITLGTYILEAMKENNTTKFLNIGTRWQHVGNKRYCPANLYAATKEAFKDILIYYETRGIKHKTIELCDTFGPGDTRKKILNLLITACQKHEPIDLSPGEQMLDLSYVDDICQFILTGIQSEGFFDNKTISCSGTVIKLRDLGEMVEKKYKISGFLKWGAKPYRDHEIMTAPIYYKKIELNSDSLDTYLENTVVYAN